MKRFTTLSALGLCLVYCLGIITPTVAVLDSGAAFAATPPAPSSSNSPAVSSAGSGQALEIAPPLITLTANPGQTIKTQIKLRDIAKDKLLVTNQINDFVAAGETGTPKIITGNDPNNPYTIKDWITPLQQLVLSPRQIKTLDVTIHIPANASPGGHYGIIRFTGTPPHLKGTGVSLSASLGALVLLTVNGKLTHKLSVSQFSSNNKDGTAKTIFQSAPVHFTIKIKNSGNVQELPTGHITVSDMFGKDISNVLVNTPPHNVLPGSTRKFEVVLGSTTIGNKRLFGKYHAVLHMNYGPNNKKTLSSSLTFWVIPYRLIAIVIAILIIGFFILRFFLRRYNRHILNKAKKEETKQSEEPSEKSGADEPEKPETTEKPQEAEEPSEPEEPEKEEAEEESEKPEEQ